MVMTIKILNEDGNTKAVSHGENETTLAFFGIYEEGDRIVFECGKKNCFVVLQPDDALGESLVYITENNISYAIPFGEKKISYSPKAFWGQKHYLSARVAEDFEVSAYRNVALNAMDLHGDTHVFPHAVANVETRGESVFAARNAIDGVKENRSHGEWPYESWGINMQDDATMKVLFGRNVTIDRIRLYTRADFPHDNWWRKVTLRFSDGSKLEWNLEKSQQAHEITFEEKTVEWVELCELMKSEEESPFPALSQIEVYGKESCTD
jgi:hypothetical protein